MVVGQSLMHPLFGIYDQLFMPLLSLGPHVSLAFFSVALAALITVIYWLGMDLEKADEIKDKLDEHQEKMQEAQENGGEVSEHMQEAIRLNTRFMKLNLKPMIGTMAFFILFFPWMNATYAPQIHMNATGNNTFRGQLEWAGSSTPVKVDNTTSEYRVKLGDQSAGYHGYVNAYGVDWQVAGLKSDSPATLNLNAALVHLPFSLPLVGKALNWLGFYFIIVMPVGYAMRKAAGIA